jgi:hypothetical protein
MEPFSQLLCTFSTLEGYLKDIEDIVVAHQTLNDCVFVLQNTDMPSEVFLTYNVEKQSSARHYKTISIHRKKDANVLYSINALNKLVMDDGGKDHNHQINWPKYKNSIVINSDSGLRIISTKLLTIHRIK